MINLIYTVVHNFETASTNMNTYQKLLLLLLLVSGGDRWSPSTAHWWDEVGWRVRWGWCGPAGSQGGEGQQREWRLWRKGVKVDMQWGNIARLSKPCQELSDLVGCCPHIPRGQVCGMSGTAKKMGHRVVSGAAVGAGGVIGPAYRVTVGHGPWAMAGIELWEGAPVWPQQQLFGWVNWSGGGHEHLDGFLRPNGLLYHPASEEAGAQRLHDGLEDEPL